jgi:hypothetical protein
MAVLGAAVHEFVAPGKVVDDPHNTGRDTYGQDWPLLRR